MTFWDRLQIAAKHAGLPANPAYVAKTLGLNPSAATKYKHGSYPHRHNLNKLAQHYRVSSEWLGSGQGSMKLAHTAAAAEGNMDAQTKELLELWATLSPQAQERTLANIRYESRVTSAENTGIRRAVKDDELQDTLAKLLALVKDRQQ